MHEYIVTVTSAFNSVNFTFWSVSDATEFMADAIDHIPDTSLITLSKKKMEDDK